MPFTLSHAAAVLPALRADGTGRGRLVPAVLVAGSFAPDTTYYAAGVVPGAMRFGRVTHSFPGVFTVDVLTAWALVGLWLVLREPLVALLPSAARPRAAEVLGCGRPRTPLSARTVAWWYASAALGSLTHVVWDAFTHPGRWGTRLVPRLAAPLAGVPLYRLVQYGSSALAAVLIVLFAARALRRAAPRGAVPGPSARRRGYAVAVIAGCVTAGAAERAVRWRHGAPDAPLWQFVPTLCFGAGAGLLAGLLLYAAATRLRGRSAGAPAAGADGDAPGRRDGVGAAARGDGPAPG
ncbi:DUF4184 family protein [Streptomyces sp. NPDC008150]|uniref:DUF4184 family protein n=1 Tax=Streptomyces sp. NPDC008150 TaxID=3364816 RepID=UPI0036EE2191